MVATVVVDVLAWLLFVGVAVLGLTVTAIGTAHIFRNMQKDGRTSSATTVLAAVVAIVLFLGGWLLLALYWLVTKALGTTRRTESG